MSPLMLRVRVQDSGRGPNTQNLGLFGQVRDGWIM